ncbi:hypothetical protein HX004_06360 [Myroides sp. 1354]|uniref:tetratricopeptide repeat protein n=1 Tax=unclassified Myroides TaxID=2642485 RepID=UPI0025790777|nr:MULTISPECIES: hypothetical protein [unclassified Myroides]MDM1044684.1 hypothetical protein [Myroides sp. R163-1]MDM1055397.1 hypothetical protein [Myroides sp. 1354]MDM1068694.1 hypothetical protein [Myroides sp. 1372]
MKKYVYFILLGFLGFPLLAQQRYEDSLKQRLQVVTQPSEQMALALRLSDRYRVNEQYDEALTLAQDCLKQALTKNPKGIEVVKANCILANIYANIEDFDQAQTYADQALKVAETQRNPIGLAYAYYAKAVLHTILFDNKATIQWLHKALNQLDNQESEADLLARIYYLLYGVYTEWNDEVQALNYANKTLEYAIIGKNKNIVANAYNALAVVYSFQYEKTGDQNKRDQMMLALDQAIALYKTYPGEVVANTYAYILNNKASYYLKYYDTTNPTIKQSIIELVHEAIRIVPSTNDVALASGYGILSELSMKDNDLVAAETYLIKAYLLAVQKKKPYYHTLINILNSLVNLQVKKGDYQRALAYQQEAISYSNLLFNEETAATVNRLEVQFELKKKEQEILTLQETVENKQKQKFLLLGVIALGVIGGFFMFRSYHFNLRYSLAREKQLEAENNQAKLKVKYQEEEQARLKAEQDLLEVKQQQLETVVLASQLQLQHKREVLKQVKANLNHAQSIDIQQILREEQMTATSFEKT